MWMIHIIKWKTDREREKGDGYPQMITADRLSYVQTGGTLWGTLQSSGGLHRWGLKS